MHQYINAVLQKLFGVRIQRVPKKNINQNNINKIYKNPIYIEFVGVPGVGKTTLYNEVSNNYVLWNNFIGGGNSFSCDFYESLAELKLKTVTAQSVSNIDKLFLLGYFYKMIIQDYNIIQTNKNIIAKDEGLIHNFGNELYTLLSKNEKFVENFIQSRAVVYCYADENSVADRILSRYETMGRLLPQHKNKSKEELIVQERITLKRKLETINFIESLNIPVLYVDTVEELAKNVDKVISFVNSLTQTE